MNLKDYFRDIQSAFLAYPLAARTVIVMLLCATAVAMLFTFGRLASWWVETASEATALQPRIARMLGFLEAQQSIEASLAQRDDVLAKMAFPDTGESGRGGALLQQEIRKLASRNGLTVIGSEVQDPEVLEDLKRLRVNVRVSGQPGQVEAFLNSMEAYRPFLFISTLSITPQQRQLLTLRAPKRERYDNTLIMELDVHAYQVGGAQ